jgi:hypothetical protein
LTYTDKPSAFCFILYWHCQRHECVC